MQAANDFLAVGTTTNSSQTKPSRWAPARIRRSSRSRARQH